MNDCQKVLSVKQQFDKPFYKEANIFIDVVKKLLKNGTTIILQHLEIKANRKSWNSLKISGN